MRDVEPLKPDELERLASAAYLGGRRDEGYEKWAAAHNAYTARGDVARAARCVLRVHRPFDQVRQQRQDPFALQLRMVYPRRLAPGSQTEQSLARVAKP